MNGTGDRHDPMGDGDDLPKQPQGQPSKMSPQQFSAAMGGAGLAIGLGAGVALDNIGVGLCIGVALWLIVGASGFAPMFAKRRQTKPESDGGDSPAE